MDFDPGTVLALAAIAFAAAFVYGVTGFGAGLVAIPLASLFFDMRFVLAVFALLDCVNAVRVNLSRPKAIGRDAAVRLVPTCIAGVALGSVLVLALPAWVLMLALGLFVTAYLLYTVAVRGALPTIAPCSRT